MTGYAQIISPPVRLIFGQHAPSLNIRRIIQDRGFIIANLARSPYLSQDQKYTIGCLLISEVLEAKLEDEHIPEPQRVPFTMIIDESGEFLGEDLKWALGAMRKYKLSLVLSAQDLETFARGELKIASKVLSMCGTVVSFRQTYRDDQEVLAYRIGTGNVNFTPHMVEVQRQRGVEWYCVPEYSESANTSTNASAGEAATAGETDTKGRSDQQSEQHGINRGDAHQRGGPLYGGLLADLHASNTVSEGAVDMTGHAQATMVSRAIQKSQTANRNFGMSKGESRNIAYKMVSLPNIVSEWERDGLEAGPVPDQYEKMKQQLHVLQPGEAFVTTLSMNRGFPVKITQIPEVWNAEVAKYAVVRGMKVAIVTQQTYTFCPEQVKGALALLGVRREGIDLLPEKTPNGADNAPPPGESPFEKDD